MSSMSKPTQPLRLIAWSLAAGSSSLAIIAWGQSLHWELSTLSIYQFFPVLGLLAFSLMWSHFMVGWLRRRWHQEKTVVHGYFEITSWVVLAALLLHPGLLAWQLWRDGFGLPPNSYLEHYVSPELGWIIWLGIVSLTAFLLFELRRVYQTARWWPFIASLSDIAILLIWYHGYRLGGNLQSGWFKMVWFVYGLTLVHVLAGTYWRRLQRAYAKVETTK